MHGEPAYWECICASSITMSIVAATCRAAGVAAAYPAAPSRKPAALNSSKTSQCSAQRTCQAACRRAAWAPPPRRLSCQAAAEKAAPEAEEEEEEEYRELTWDEKVQALAKEEDDLREQSGCAALLSRVLQPTCACALHLLLLEGISDGRTYGNALKRST